MTRDSGATLHTEERVGETADVTGTREVEESLEYGLSALADIAIIALSPAVNGPNSAVEVIEEMSFLSRDLDDPHVRMALRRFAASLQRLGLSESDRAHVEAFAAKIDVDDAQGAAH